MAMTLNAGEVGRSDLFSIDPDHIRVDERLNGRFEPHDEDSIVALAESILKHFQQQPCVVRRVDENRVQLVSGYRRWRAVKWIKENQPDKAVKLLCRVSEMNDEEAFIRNIVENKDRKTTTAIDDAHNHNRLREGFGWDDEKIAGLYCCTVANVTKLRALLRAPAKVQQEVAAGNLAASAAIDLIELPKEEQAAALAEARKDDGRVSTQAVRQRVRNQRIEEGGKKARSLSEVRQFFADLAETKDEKGKDDMVRGFAELLISFIKGELSEAQMTRRLDGLVKKGE